MNWSRRDFLRLAGLLGGITALGGVELLYQSTKQKEFSRSNSTIDKKAYSPSAQLVWNPEYSFEWSRQLPYRLLVQRHVSPVDRFELLYQTMLADPQIHHDNFTSSPPLSPQDFLRVHTESYLQRLQEDADSLFGFGGLLNSENPINQKIIDFVKASCSGTYYAAVSALQQGRAMNLSGGFHHAFPDHEEGFCYLNDSAIAIKKLQQEGRIKKAMIVDCDVHQGNGNAFIFKDDSSVSIYDIYQQDNYPTEKIPDQYAYPLHSDEKIDDARYLDVLRNTLPRALQQQKPDIVFYIAGADPLATDTLGGFQLTVEGIKQRDAFVLKQGKERGLPVAVVLGGGYSRRIEDIVEANASCAREILTGG